MSYLRQKILFMAAALVVAIGIFAATTPVEAVGTDSGTVIYNNIHTGSSPDTFTAGGLALQFSNSASGNTQWQAANTGAAGDTVSDTVVQAWDISYIANNTEDTNGPGETVTFIYTVQNIGNASQSMSYLHGLVYTGAPAGLYTVWEDDGDGTFEPTAGQDTQVVGNLLLAQDAWDTIFLAIYINPNSSSGDSYVTSGTFTDNAFARNAGGDAWETGVPISAADDRDTQTDQVVTWVAGPVMRVAKSIVSKGDDRPGDTILYEIIVDNDGSGTAINIFLVDALPANCTYTVGSAAMTDSNTASGTCDIRFAQLVTQDTFAVGGVSGTDETLASKIQFRFSDPFGPQKDNDLTTVADDDNIALPDGDSARVRFEVVIN